MSRSTTPPRPSISCLAAAWNGAAAASASSGSDASPVAARAMPTVSTVTSLRSRRGASGSTAPVVPVVRCLVHGGRGEIEAWFLPEDRGLECLELAARLDPELLDELAAGVLICR